MILFGDWYFMAFITFPPPYVLRFNIHGLGNCGPLHHGKPQFGKGCNIRTMRLEDNVKGCSPFSFSFYIILSYFYVFPYFWRSICFLSALWEIFMIRFCILFSCRMILILQEQWRVIALRVDKNSSWVATDKSQLYHRICCHVGF